jgi:hypothetical protein
VRGGPSLSLDKISTLCYHDLTHFDEKEEMPSAKIEPSDMLAVKIWHKPPIALGGKR